MQGISRLAVSGGEDAISTHCSKTEAGRRVRARTTVPERKSCEGLENRRSRKSVHMVRVLHPQTRVHL